MAVLWGLLVGGCAPVIDKAASPLAPLRPAPESVALEIVSLRFKQGDEALNAQLWEQIDEQQLPIEVRRRLAANGFRVGVISGALPLELEEALKLREQLPQDGEPRPVSDVDERLDVRQNMRWIEAGRRMDLIVTGEEERHAELSVLTRDGQGQVRGRTYEQVMGLLSVKAFLAGDGRARLEVTPELEHGNPEKRFTASDGMLKVEFGAPHEVFDELKFDVTLAAGELLVVAGQPDKPGSLGYQYFSENGSGPSRQKLMLIRLSQRPVDKQAAFNALLAE